VKLNLAELQEFVKGRGIKFLPAKNTYYDKYLYKVVVDLPCSLGNVSPTTRQFISIDIRKTDYAKAELQKFYERTMNAIDAYGELTVLRTTIESTLTAPYYRSASDGCLIFYVREASQIVQLIEMTGVTVHTVTGPITESHATAVQESNVITREKLFYEKYRYVIDFRLNTDFSKNDFPQLLGHLETLDKDTWKFPKMQFVVRHSQSSHGHYHSSHGYSHWIGGSENVQLYLEDGNDFVYLKMMVPENIAKSREVKLWSELTSDDT
jgi:hypothetical protein